MRMYVLLETQVWTDPETQEETYFDTTKLIHPRMTHWVQVVGSYDYVAYLSDVSVTQALAVVDILTDDPTIVHFTPLLAFSL